MNRFNNQTGPHGFWVQAVGAVGVPEAMEPLALGLPADHHEGLARMRAIFPTAPHAPGIGVMDRMPLTFNVVHHHGALVDLAELADAAGIQQSTSDTALATAT